MVRPTQTVILQNTKLLFRSRVQFRINCRASIGKKTENFFGLFIQNICSSVRLSTISCIVLSKVVVGQFLSLSSCCNLLS